MQTFKETREAQRKLREDSRVANKIISASNMNLREISNKKILPKGYWLVVGGKRAAPEFDYEEWRKDLDRKWAAARKKTK